MHFRHYRTSPNQSMYFGITLDRYKPTRLHNSTWTIDILWGHHTFVVFWSI